MINNEVFDRHFSTTRSRTKMDIFEEYLIPERLVPDKRMIICYRKEIKDMLAKLSLELSKDVQNVTNETELQMNVMYAAYLNKGWFRTMLKFKRSYNVFVIQLVDVKGIFDVTADMQIRKVQSKYLYNLKCGEIKMLIYGIGNLFFDDEF